MTSDSAAARPRHWTTDELLIASAAAVSGDSQSLLNSSEGRWVGVLASPILANSQYLATGVSALPPRYAAPIHAHVAEEIAVILAGSGMIDIEGEKIDVQTGSVVFTPSNLSHQTVASESGLTVLWIYGPAGSEGRWIAPPTDERGEDG